MYWIKILSNLNYRGICVVILCPDCICNLHQTNVLKWNSSWGQSHSPRTTLFLALSIVQIAAIWCHLTYLVLMGQNRISRKKLSCLSDSDRLESPWRNKISLYFSFVWKTEEKGARKSKNNVLQLRSGSVIMLDVKAPHPEKCILGLLLYSNEDAMQNHLATSKEVWTLALCALISLPWMLVSEWLLWDLSEWTLLSLSQMRFLSVLRMRKGSRFTLLSFFSWLSDWLTRTCNMFQSLQWSAEWHPVVSCSIFTNEETDMSQDIVQCYTASLSSVSHQYYLAVPYEHIPLPISWKPFWELTVEQM